MKFISVIVALAAVALPAFAEGSVEVTYNTIYDNPNTPLSITACSNGANGLQTKGYDTLGELPSFPYVGGIPGLTWNSPDCGSCWQLSYTDASGTTRTITVTGVDGAWSFNLSLEAMNALTGGIAQEKGTVTATATQVSASLCGM
ncbi:Cerato-platanin [Pisolithus orientalis]|uniref:Cerato-platanin n=1 Tax=Pisolithus orientalis TaxID=936130 RepID=UPI002225A47B|nr:Cerato-platanin [Pisolithus orientalis]KAI6030945.1 Cerato-platanin [Pisolithus orientalis]